MTIQHKKYDNETTDGMIKNENAKFKKSSYEEVREIVKEKEKSNSLLKISLRKTKLTDFFKNFQNCLIYANLIMSNGNCYC